MKTALMNESMNKWKKTRPVTRLPQSRAGGQEPYLRSVDHFGQEQTNRPTDKAGVESRARDLKLEIERKL